MTEADAFSRLDERVARIEERNLRVEADKAWETSWIRRLLVALLTYATIAVYLQFVVHISPWINAVVPTASFLISTLALGAVKGVWLARRQRRRGETPVGS